MYVDLIDEDNFSFSLKQTVLAFEMLFFKEPLNMLIKLFVYISLSSTEKAAILGSAGPHFVTLIMGHTEGSLSY